MMKNAFPGESPYIRKSERYLIAALVLFSLAIFVLSVVVFSLGPLSVAGSVAVGIGVILMLACIACFALYDHYQKKEEERAPEE